MTCALERPLPMVGNTIKPLTDLPETGIDPAERAQGVQRLINYNVREIPMSVEIEALDRVHAEALEEDSCRSLGAAGIYGV